MSVTEKLQEIDEEVSNQLAHDMLRDGRIALIFVCSALIGAISFYAYTFGFSIVKDKNEWGAFGDFIGGLLNPIVGVVTVFLVLLNARLQRLELRNSLREMKNSNLALKKQNASLETQEFQNIFFSWLGTHRANVSELRFVHSTGFPEYRGKSALFYIYKHYLTEPEISRNFADVIPPQEVNSLMAGNGIVDRTYAQCAEDTILKAWEKTKQRERDNLEVPLQSLLALINWLSEGGNIPISKRHECFRVLKSQLSSAELVFLFYESWSVKPYIRKRFAQYSLFEQLKVDQDPLITFMLKRAQHLDH